MNNSSAIDNISLADIPQIQAGLDQDGDPYYITTCKVLAYAVVMVLALVGNILIIACYIQTKTAPRLQRAVHDCLILSLAFSDILLPVFAVPERITRIYTHEQWVLMGTFGIIICKLVNFNEAISIVVSLLTLDAIAIDRLTAVLFPFRKTLNKRGINCLIVLIWFVAIAYNSPLLYFSSIVNNEGNVSCTARSFLWNFRSWRRFYLGLSSVSLLLIFTSYTAIALRISTTKYTLRKMSIVGRKREISNRKVLKTSSIIIVAFFLCYFIYWLQALLCSFENSLDICKNHTFRYLAVYLAILNSALNPVIYFVCSSRYRKGLHKLLTSSTPIQQ